MGHEYCGIVEDVGSAVTSVKPGQFVIGSFSPPTIPAPTADSAISLRASIAKTSARAQAPLPARAPC